MPFEVLLQPFLLFRTGSASAYPRRIAICVQGHHMPFPQVIAVISFAIRPGSFAPICEIRQRAWRGVFVISRRRPSAIFEFSPGRVVALAEFFRRSAIVG